MSTNVVNPDTVADEVASHNDAMQSKDVLEGHDAMVEFKKDEKLPDLSEMRVFKEEQEINQNNLVSQEPILIDFSTLFRENNVRTAACLALPQMVRSLRSRGYDPACPISVSGKADGRNGVLRGNRRTEALEIIQRLFPDDFARILPNGKIPALVYERLSFDQEVILRNDHSSQNGQVGLDQWSQFLQIVQLMKAGINTQAEVAAKVGEFTEVDGELVPARARVQQRCNLARLPQFIIDEFEILLRQKDPDFIKERGDISTLARMGKIAGLWKAHISDREKGHIDNINGGPLLQARWAEILKPSDDVAEEAAKPSAPTAAMIREWSGQVTDDIISETLLKASGQDTARSFSDLDAEQSKLRQGFQTLENIQLHLGGKKFRALVKEANKTAKETATCS